MSTRPIEPEARWLGNKAFWGTAGVVAAALVAGFCIQWHRIAGRRAQPQELFLYGQSTLTPGLPSVFRACSSNKAMSSRAAFCSSRVESSQAICDAIASPISSCAVTQASVSQPASTALLVAEVACLRPGASPGHVDHPPRGRAVGVAWIPSDVPTPVAS